MIKTTPTLLLLSFFLLVQTTLLAQPQAALQSPDDFLPMDYGQDFTLHHEVVDYVYHVAQHSPRVRVEEYGRTPEGRPMLLAYVSSEENLAQLEDIRINNLRKTGLESGNADADLDRAIVWLSFGVHGNEAGAIESSISTLYELARPANTNAEQWLENTVVIIDPCLNPDGFARYVNWYRGIANRLPNPQPGVREHDEPWPGGRVNHYCFDLNRDWAWQTQPESAQRMVSYHAWMPHLHVDYHEQYPENPYYFAPAAAPFHPYISQWQRDFQYDVGENHARYFDRNGWLYFTREIFDLLYPSYGDTYPTFHGSVGMTHEQAGHGIAGRAYLLSNRDTLSLQDRIDHHTATALSSVEVASANAEAIVRNFGDYFERGRNNPDGQYKTYIISRDNSTDRLRALTELLDRNSIAYQSVEGNTKVNGYRYLDNSTGSVSVQKGDLLVSAYQPLSVLTQVLFEPAPELEDSLTYDITAWSLPYAFGLKAYATTQRINSKTDFELEQAANSGQGTPYAFALPWTDVASAALLSDLLQRGIRVRFATAGFQIGGEAFEAGTLVITRADNRKQADWATQVRQATKDAKQNLTALNTGFAESGPDLGSDAMAFLEAPRVALLHGESINPNGFGEAWHLLEQLLAYPVDVYDAEDISRVAAGDYDVLLMPSGSYDWSSEEWTALNKWINGGGRLIALGRAVGVLAGQEGFSIEQQSETEEEEELDTENDSRLHPYSGAARRNVTNSIPGAIFTATVDETHPLAFGLDGHYHTLRTSASSFAYLESGNAAYLQGPQDPVGFAGAEALKQVENSLVFGREDKGRGSVTYLPDNPLFRGFWRQGQLVFCNALFLAE